MKVSGKTTNLAPPREASPIASSTKLVVISRLARLGAICTAAALIITTGQWLKINRFNFRFRKEFLYCPSINYERIVTGMNQTQVQNILRSNGDDTGKKGGLTMSVESLQSKAATVYFSTFTHKLL